MNRILLLLLLAAAPVLANPQPLVLGVGASRAVPAPRLAKASVADGKIARARAVGESELLITGLAPGGTTVHVWDESGNARVYAVTVVRRELFPQVTGRGPTDVIQVGLEFLELDGSQGLRYGLRWPELVEGSAGATVHGGPGGVVAHAVATLATAKGWIEQLVTEGRARLLANPLLYVRLGETVSFHSGGEFPVNTSSQQEGRTYPRIEWKPFGLTVKVTPHSGDGVHLSSDVQVEIIETDPSLQVDGVPALTRRKLDTKMESRDGETVILSGLVRRVAVEGKEGVPILSDIPILGILFSRSRQSDTESEILLAMTLSFRTRARHDEHLEGARGRLKGDG